MLTTNNNSSKIIKLSEYISTYLILGYGIRIFW